VICAIGPPVRAAKLHDLKKRCKLSSQTTARHGFELECRLGYTHAGIDA